MFARNHRQVATFEMGIAISELCNGLLVLKFPVPLLAACQESRKPFGFWIWRWPSGFRQRGMVRDFRDDEDVCIMLRSSVAMGGEV